MQKVIGQSVLVGMCFIALSACQNTQHAIKTAQIRYAALTPNAEATVKIFCSGTNTCEFERIGNVPVVSDTTHLVSNEAIQKGFVRLKASSTLQSNALYLTVPAQQYEVVVRFYPISIDRAETIHVIHPFKANKTYTFTMYRDRVKRANNLLNAAVPDPLCVKVMEEKRVVRRFCKPYNVLTGLGEFVEQKN